VKESFAKDPELGVMRADIRYSAGSDAIKIVDAMYQLITRPALKK